MNYLTVLFGFESYWHSAPGILFEWEPGTVRNDPLSEAQKQMNSEMRDTPNAFLNYHAPRL